ncbi:hypothetical protein BDP81DRAFT_422492 [Colletotrichum phormii]|uniref:Uncharacterized protein n=1 Tax=Colletotrichum phormii TaxID=359342 RepID=A0AAI9ZVM7_9PEZI|nr:uncharacterized protein BDP81DRAFT_422492 [Colletotrichum phormii]KAK1638691.1 hypothetical protein BDP81DRAFT_422492 [Colletotrichum phormii]
MSSEDSGLPSASDLITYIGVPLTVIGLLPIIYNVVATLIHLQKIKRVLRRNGISPPLRSDIFNRIVEVEFPWYRIQSPQPQLSDGATENQSIASNNNIRLRNLSSTTSTSREECLPPIKHSDIPGGSWSFLEWKGHQIGTKTQRTQPGDNLRQPRAQIRFWDLILRLYQSARGTVDTTGWSELQESPLWVRGRHLMTLSDTPQKSTLILQVASYHDSESSISLELVRSGPRSDWSSFLRDEPVRFTTHGSITLPCHNQLDQKSRETEDEVASDAGSIMCDVTVDGLVAVYPSSRNWDSFNIEHLRIGNGLRHHQGVWFASCAMVLYARSSTPILEYRVPINIRRLAKTAFIPEGVIRSLYGKGGEEIPFMITRKYLKPEGGGQEGEIHPPVTDTYIWKEREMNIRKKSRAEFDSQIKRIENVVNTTAMKGPELQEATIDWLRSRGHIPATQSMEEATKTILFRMVTEQDFAKSLCRILDNWNEWVGRGEMSVMDFCIINQIKATFAQASLVILVLADLENGPAFELDIMQECAAKWEYVELG